MTSQNNLCVLWLFRWCDSGLGFATLPRGGVERIAKAVADEVCSHHGEDDGDPRKRCDPRSVNERVTAGGDHASPGWGRGGMPIPRNESPDSNVMAFPTANEAAIITGVIVLGSR